MEELKRRLREEEWCEEQRKIKELMMEKVRTEYVLIASYDQEFNTLTLV